jgi:hypothetical protein
VAKRSTAQRIADIYTNVEAARHYVDATAGALQLTEIRETFELSRTELSHLLRRRAATIAKWEHRGIPRERQASVETLVDLARLFRARLIPSRIPEIVRTPDDWLGGRTMLQTLAQDGVDPIYAYLARLFR